MKHSGKKKTQRGAHKTNVVPAVAQAELEDVEPDGQELGLAVFDDPAAASPAQRAGGAVREYAWLTLICGLIGLFASLELTISELTRLADPQADLACDINPLIGCGDFFDLRAAHIFFGIPNAVVGLMAFAALSALAVALASGAHFARWLWQLMSAGVTVGIVFVLWFEYYSFFVKGGLCPWCAVTWAVVIPLFVHTIARAAQGGHLPLPERLTRTLVLDRWVITIGWWLLTVVVVVVVFWNEWLALLR